MNFENTFIKKQINAQKKSVEKIISKNEEDHIEKINDLHLKAQDIHSEVVKKSTDLENEEIAEMAFLGDIEGIEKREIERNNELDNYSSVQDRIIEEMDKKDGRDQVIDMIKNNPFSVN